MGELTDLRGTRPWRVVTVGDGALVEDYDAEGAAKAHAKRANASAEELGIVARYEVRSHVAKP